MTKEEREELIKARDAKKAEKAKEEETKQTEEDKALIEEAKALGLDVSKYEKKQPEQPSKTEKIDGNTDLEKLGKVMGTAFATAIKEAKTETTQTKDEDVKIHF